MKKIFFFLSVAYFLTNDIDAQRTTFRASTNSTWNLQKIDTLFFTEYYGQKPTPSIVGGDTAFSQSILVKKPLSQK